MVVVYGSTNHSHMCAHRIAAAGGIRRERERVFTAHTINTGVPLMRGEATVTSSISLQALGARHDRSTTYVGVYGDRGKGLYRDLSSSCCRHLAMRHSNGARDAPVYSLIGCKVARHMRIPLHKRASVAAIETEPWGRFARPRASREQHRRDTANHRCAWVQVREEEYLL